MFIFAADLHLSLITWQRLPEVNDDSLESFREVLNMADAHNSPLVLGGDVFDSVKMLPSLLMKAIDIRNQFPSVPIYYINGNHDAIDPSWCSFFENAYRLGAQPITLPDGEVLCGIDYQLPENFPEAVKHVYPGCDYLIIHQTLDKLSGGLPGSVDSTPLQEFNCVLAGDYHKTVQYNNLYSPGSTNRRSIAEDGGHFIMVTPDRVAPVELDSRPLLQIQENDISPIDTILDELYAKKPRNEKLQKGILVIRGEITTEIKEYWIEAIQDAAYLLFVPQVNVSPEVELDATAGVSVARGSKAYMREMLEKYLCEESGKRVILSYLDQPDMYMELLRTKLT